MIRLVALVACLAGCYDAPKPECGFFCGPDLACPADYTCASSDRRCHLNGSPANLVCPGLDAMPQYSPRIVFTNPASGATMVDPETTIEIGFDVNVAGVSNSTFTVTLTSTTTPVIGAVNYDGPTRRATFLRPNGLPPNAEMLVALTEEIFDPVTGSPLMPGSYTFSTGPDTTSPTVIATDPINGSTGAPVITNVSFSFSEDVVNVTGTTVRVLDGATPVMGTVSYFAGNRMASFNPQDQLLPNHPYTGQVTTGVADLAGNPLAATFTMSFTTGADTFQPNVLMTLPGNMDTNVPVNTNIFVTFDEPVMGVDATSFQVNGGAIAGTLTMSNGNKTVTFDPATDLPAATTISVSLSSAITDTSSNALQALTFSFTTL